MIPFAVVYSITFTLPPRTTASGNLQHAKSMANELPYYLGGCVSVIYGLTKKMCFFCHPKFRLTHFAMPKCTLFLALNIV